MKLRISISSVCDCNTLGSSNSLCDSKGVCTCKENISGDKCNECKNGYFGFPNCEGKTPFVDSYY